MKHMWQASLVLVAMVGCSGDSESAGEGGASAAGGQAAGGQAGAAGKASGGSAGASQGGAAGAGAGGAGQSGKSGAPSGGQAGAGGKSAGGAGSGATAGASGGTAGAPSGGQAGVAGAGGKADAGSGGQPAGQGGAAAGGESGSSGQGGEGGSAGQAGGAGEAGQAGSGGQGGESGGSGGQAGQTGQGGAAGQGGATDPPGTWRSVLYPQKWVPLHEGGKADSEGRFLHDFSHAGYHRGEVRPPYGQGAVVSTVDATKGDGKTDATAAIQKAIDDACKAGGGVVRLPAGTYRVKMPSDSATAAIVLSCSHLVLRGDGPTQSRILFDDPKRLRSKSVVALRPASGGTIFDGGSTKTFALTEDAPVGTRTVQVSSSAGLAVGDWIVVRNETTPEFRAEHRMDKAHTGDASDWWTSDQFKGIVYPRKITAIQGGAITVDAPTRYVLKTRDKARLYKLSASYLEEVGLESLGFGAVQNTSGPTGGTESSHDDDYNTAGTTGYEVHASRFIDVGAVHDGWVHDVRSFAPSENAASGVHVLSNGLQFSQHAFRFTIDQTEIGRAQYRGGGGNGYLFHVQGNDLLFSDDQATSARHGFILNQATSGNVFLRVRVVTSRLTDDGHRFLSQGNLYDGVQLDQGWLSSVNRGNTSSGGGFTGTTHVFWNTQVIKNHASAKGCAVETAQWDWGYVIGTQAASGQSAKVCTAAVTNGYWASLDQGDPVDFTEGVGEGAKLYPPSLYDDQLARRCAVEGLTCTP